MKAFFGVMLALGLLLLLIARSCDTPTTADNASPPIATVSPTPPPAPTFPTSGEGHANKEVGLKAYLDPQRTFTRPSGRARYVFAEDPSLYYDDLAGASINRDAKRRRIWWDMPEGKYIVYPLEADDIFFRWWQ